MATAVIALYYLQLPLLEGIEARTWDSRLRLAQSSQAPLQKIAIVAIDEKSITELGRFPWSRSVYANLIDSLSRSGVRAVLMDVLFTDPESPRQDNRLAQSIRQNGRVYLAEFLEYDRNGNAGNYKQSLPVLRKAAHGSGHINLYPDQDGVIRWSALTVPFHDKFQLSLPLRGAMELIETEGVSQGKYTTSLAGKNIPTDDQHRLLIDYSASSGNFETFSFSDIITNRVPAEKLRDKVIFVGATAVGIYDLRVTPLSGNTPGVVLKALITDTIARGKFLRRGGLEAIFDLTAILVLSLMTAIMVLRLRHAVTLPLLITTALGYILLCHGALKLGSWISMFYPLSAMTLSFVGTAFVRFQLLDRRAREIRAMFSRFVSAKIVDRLVKNPELACISGENRVITILFADVQNYTSFSERHEPREIVAVLNMYLSEMVSIITQYDGTMDKFLGDGILAYWNAPLDQPDHAERAVNCALEMIRRGDLLRERIATQCGEPLSWGIGINTGEVVAGIIGAAETKMEYTVIGDNVNLTYRIQNLSRDANCPIITKALYERVADVVAVEPMQAVYVKGREKPVEIYALKGIKHA
ncbi:MAG TPA: adenylate/guanylate cyclase domain-containing protein [Desulfuromonadaceae bacterium]|jgi:adenylate cyclase